jgi:hypothetical protein
MRVIRSRSQTTYLRIAVRIALNSVRARVGNLPISTHPFDLNGIFDRFGLFIDSVSC